MGRTVAVTTDAGQRWTKPWTTWEDYDRLYTQMVRWAMRPTTGDGKLAMFAEARDGKLRTIVTALDDDERFLNFLMLRGSVVGPSMKPVDLAFQQFAPGATSPSVRSKRAGTTSSPSLGDKGAPAAHRSERAPFGRIPRCRRQPYAAGRSGRSHPEGADPGQLIDRFGADAQGAGVTNVFRHDLPKAVARQAVWHFWCWPPRACSSSTCSIAA